jgi:hypothetical protein
MERCLEGAKPSPLLPGTAPPRRVDELAPLHPITSPAWASNIDGTPKLSVLAVFRL